MSNSKVAIQNLYSEKSEFIIIGLTGRTGSGCSTSAKILSQDYASIGIDVNHDVKTNEDRRNRIIDSYAKSNWKEFKIIEVRNVITTFILEEEFDMLISFIGTELITFISGDAIKEELTKKNKISSQNLIRCIH